MTTYSLEVSLACTSVKVTPHTCVFVLSLVELSYTAVAVIGHHMYNRDGVEKGTHGECVHVAAARAHDRRLGPDLLAYRLHGNVLASHWKIIGKS